MTQRLWGAGGPSTRNEHPIGVWYDSSEQMWAVFNQDRAPMQPDAAFHYVVGSSRHNSLGAGITIDEEGRIVYGNIFGKTRILR